MIRKTLFGITFVLVILIVALIIQGVFFYRTRTPMTPPEISSLEGISVPAPPSGEFPKVHEKQKGCILLDLGHSNNFSLRELHVLESRIVSKGYTFEYLEQRREKEEITDEEEAEEEEEPTDLEEKLTDLEEKLRFVDALIIILPQEPFSRDEVGKVKEFVRKGGKVLLVGEPTRASEINSIATEFGLIFESGYLYNLKEYEANFRNIFIHEFRENELTRNLRRITFYCAGSISPADRGIAFADENTFSSLIRTSGMLSPVALSENSKVLAIADFTFMREPFSSVLDNNQFISNIADWLTKSERAFLLSDFPYFFEEDVHIAYADASLLDFSAQLRKSLVDIGKNPEIGEYKQASGISGDLIFIGLFDDAIMVEDYLERGDILVSPKTKVKKIAEEETPLIEIEIKGLGQVYREEGTSLLYLHENGDGHFLIILSDTEEVMQETIDMLENGQFRSWLVADMLGIYHAAPAVPT